MKICKPSIPCKQAIPKKMSNPTNEATKKTKKTPAAVEKSTSFDHLQPNKFYDLHPSTAKPTIPQLTGGLF